jgi:hypothetical protein
LCARPLVEWPCAHLAGSRTAPGPSQEKGLIAVASQ